MFEKMAIFVNKESGDRFMIYREDFQEILNDYDISETQAELLPLEQATAEELASQIGSELENANYHSVVRLPEDFLEKLKERGFDEAQQLEALWALADSMQSFFY